MTIFQATQKLELSLFDIGLCHTACVRRLIHFLCQIFEWARKQCYQQLNMKIFEERVDQSHYN